MSDLDQAEKEFSELEFCKHKMYIGEMCGLCLGEKDKEITSLKEKVKVFEQENAHLRKVNGIKLRRTTIKQSLVYANDALEKECTRVKELEAISETYSNEWDACKKQASTLAEKVEQKDAKIRELETELMYKGRSYPVIKFSEILSLQAQIAVLLAGLEKGIGFLRTVNAAYSDTCPQCDKLSKRAHDVKFELEQAFSSNGSELLEAVRDITEAVEELLEPMPHLLHGVFGENAHADISERIENAEKSLSRLKGLV